MEFRQLLMGLALVWIAAKLAGEGMERIGQTAVLGELLAGVLIGPGGRRLMHESEALHVLAELGVLILLFEVRLKSDLDELLRAGAQATLVAVAGMALPLEFGFGVMRWFVTRPSWPFSSARRSPLAAWVSPRVCSLISGVCRTPPLVWYSGQRSWMTCWA